MNFVLAGLIALMFFAHFMALRSVERERRAERDAWAQERRELANRIQRPEVIPTPVSNAPVPLHVVPEDEGEMALVGTVVGGSGEDE